MVDWRYELSTPPIRATTSGRSGSSCSSTSAGLAVQEEGRRSTGARASRPCSPTSRSIDGYCERCGRAGRAALARAVVLPITDYAERCSTTSTGSTGRETTQDGAAQLDRPLRGRGDRLRDAGARGAIRGLHHAARHALRRHVHGAGAGAPAGATQLATAERSARDVDAYRGSVAAHGPGGAQGRRQGEDGRVHRRVRHQSRRPAQAIPVWIADYVLMEYGTGAIMAVPATTSATSSSRTKFGLPIVRVIAGPGEDAAHAARRRRTDDAEGRLVNSAAVRRPAGARRPSARSPRGCEAQALGEAASSSTGCTTGASRGSATGARRSRSSTATPAARCRCRRRTCRSCCRTIEDFRPDDSGVSPLARARGVVSRAVPDVRQARPARDRRVRHLPRLGVVLPALSVAPSRDDVPFDPALTQQVAARSTRTSAATSTRCCTCCTRASSPWCCTTSGTLRVRGAVHEVPRARPDHQGRREDVEVARQRREPRRVHRRSGAPTRSACT